MSLVVNDQNLGHATAYGYAKSKGYTGTEEQFATLMASYATVGESAAASATSAATSATNASNSATSAGNSATSAATSATAAQDAAATASAAYGTDLLAPDFDILVANSAGDHVIYEGDMYLITADRAAGVAWSQTSKTKVDAGTEINRVEAEMKAADSELKSAIDNEIVLSNEIIASIGNIGEAEYTLVGEVVPYRYSYGNKSETQHSILFPLSDSMVKATIAMTNVAYIH
jgi:hypothetical protein